MTEANAGISVAIPIAGPGMAVSQQRDSLSFGAEPSDGNAQRNATGDVPLTSSPSTVAAAAHDDASDARANLPFLISDEDNDSIALPLSRPWLDHMKATRQAEILNQQHTDQRKSLENGRRDVDALASPVGKRPNRDGEDDASSSPAADFSPSEKNKEEAAVAGEEEMDPFARGEGDKKGAAEKQQQERDGGGAARDAGSSASSSAPPVPSIALTAAEQTLLGNYLPSWSHGDDLVIFCGTWNMAQKKPSKRDVEAHFLRPNAHIIAVTTQENGPYVGTNTAHDAWDRLVAESLPGFVRVASRTLWAVHLTVYARVSDVFPHIRDVHTDVVKTGSMGAALGNKGGVGIAFTLRLMKLPSTIRVHPGDGMTPLAMRRAHSPNADLSTNAEAAVALPSGSHGIAPAKVKPASKPPSLQQSLQNSQRASRGASPEPQAASPPLGAMDPSSVWSNAATTSTPPPSSAMLNGDTTHAPPPVPQAHAPPLDPMIQRVPVMEDITLLFIGAHLTAHQEHVERRNQDYARIVQRLAVGTKGPFKGAFSRRLAVRKNARQGCGASEEQSPAATAPAAPLEKRQAKKNQSNADKAATTSARDVTDEFDICVFMGDLNYRIEGTAGAIRHIVAHHKTLRAALSANDQLRREMAKGIVFHGFREGPLRFRPSYKYKIPKAPSVEQEHYEDGPKARLPGYCDRVLVKVARWMEVPIPSSKKRNGSTAAHPVADPSESPDIHSSAATTSVPSPMWSPLSIEHYSDVKHVVSSDHRPVACLLRLQTRGAPFSPVKRDEAQNDGCLGCC